MSQIVSIDEDEQVIDVFNEKDFNQHEAFYIMATRNGMIKKSSVPQFKTTRYNKPLIAMKVKEQDEVINIMR